MLRGGRATGDVVFCYSCRRLRGPLGLARCISLSSSLSVSLSQPGGTGRWRRRSNALWNTSHPSVSVPVGNARRCAARRGESSGRESLRRSSTVRRSSRRGCASHTSQRTPDASLNERSGTVSARALFGVCSPPAKGKHGSRARAPFVKCLQDVTHHSFAVARTDSRSPIALAAAPRDESGRLQRHPTSRLSVATRSCTGCHQPDHPGG